MLSVSSITVTSNRSMIVSWYNTVAWMNYYFSIFLFLFGIVGNILNIFVLSQRLLRSNPCAWLFLISSFANFIVILAGLTTRIISNWTIDLTDTVGWLCKFRVYTLYTSRTIASWLIMLATTDRWVLSCRSVHRRQMSTLKNAQWGTMITILFSLSIYLPIFYCYEANLINTPLKCYSKTIICRIFVDQVYTCITILFPLILMFLFGFMTMANVRKLKQRIQYPLLSTTSTAINSNEHRKRFRQIDRHLLIMLLVKISFLVLFTLPQAIQQIYSTITRNKYKTLKQHMIEDSIYSFAILLTYLASGMPFYIYTLCGGRVFRQAIMILFIRMKRKIFCQQN